MVFFVLPITAGLKSPVRSFAENFRKLGMLDFLLFRLPECMRGMGA
jgi:hypothetical protein